MSSDQLLFAKGVAGRFFGGMRDALTRGVDRNVFALKRCFHSMLRLSRKDFKALGFTPARMDILHGLRLAKGPIWQSRMRRILGYTARSTTTFFMKALQKLGLIRRKRSELDRRQLEVTLTRAGLAMLEACDRHFSGGWSLDGPRVALDWGYVTDEEEEAWSAYLARYSKLTKLLGNVRVALRDTGCIPYPGFRWFSD